MVHIQRSLRKEAHAIFKNNKAFTNKENGNYTNDKRITRAAVNSQRRPSAKHVSGFPAPIGDSRISPLYIYL